MKGYQHLFELALAAENVARQSYQGDAYASAASKVYAELTMERALAAADQVAEIAAKIREARHAS